MVKSAEYGIIITLQHTEVQAESNDMSLGHIFGETFEGPLRPLKTLKGHDKVKGREWLKEWKREGRED